MRDGAALALIGFWVSVGCASTAYKCGPAAELSYQLSRFLSHERPVLHNGARAASCLEGPLPPWLGGMCLLLKPKNKEAGAHCLRPGYALP